MHKTTARKGRFVLMLLGVAIGTTTVKAQVREWATPTSGVWSDPENWTPEGVPSAVDEDVAIVVPGVYWVIVDDTVAVRNLHMLNSQASMRIAGPHSLSVYGDTLWNYGSILMTTGPGNSPATMTILGDARLGGAGTLSLGAGADANSVRLHAAGSVVNEQEHTIRGTGRVTGAWVNDGVIVADENGKAIRIENGSFHNRGEMLARNGAMLQFLSSTLAQQETGSIAAEGGTVTLQNSVVQGGTVATRSGDATFVGLCGASGVTFEGPVSLQPGATVMSGAGALRNNGIVTVNTAGSSIVSSIRFTDGGVLAGSGEIRLNAGGNLYSAHLHTSTPMIHAEGHTVRGRGEMTGPWTNEGAIVASAMRLSGGPWVNRGSIRGADASSQLTFSSAAIVQTGAGNIAGPGSLFLENSSIVGGQIFGRIQVAGSSAIDGVQLEGGLVGVYVQTATLHIGGGGIVNNGTIVANAHRTDDPSLRVASGAVLSGHGRLELGSVGSVVQATGAAAVNGADHTIVGFGRLRGDWVNHGVVAARLSNLYVDNGQWTNYGVMRAETGTLLLNGGTITQAGLGRIAAVGGTVWLSGARVEGGVLDGRSGVVTSNGLTRLSGVEVLGAVQVASGSTLRIGSTGLVNNGVIVVNATSSGLPTTLRAEPDATLEGTGTLRLNASSSFESAVLWSDGGMATIGQGQRIEGRGRLAGDFTIQGTLAPGNAEACGVIEVRDKVRFDTLSALEVKLASAHEHDVITGSAEINVSGTLRLALIGDYFPSGSDVAEIITGSAVLGRFTQVEGSHLIDGRRLHVGYTPTSVRVTVCPADWDVDGLVGTSDITAFLSDWFADRAGGNAAPFRSDYDRDGAVGTSDITAFLSAWFAARAGGC